PPSQGGDTGSNPVGAAKNQQVRGHFGGRDTAGRAGTGGRAPRTGRATCVPEEQGVFLRNAEAPDRPARSPTGARQERRNETSPRCRWRQPGAVAGTDGGVASRPWTTRSPKTAHPGSAPAGVRTTPGTTPTPPPAVAGPRPAPSTPPTANPARPPTPNPARPPISILTSRPARGEPCPRTASESTAPDIGGRANLLARRRTRAESPHPLRRDGTATVMPRRTRS